MRRLWRPSRARIRRARGLAARFPRPVSWTDVLLAALVGAAGAASYLSATRAPAPQDPVERAGYETAVQLLRLPDPDLVWLLATLGLQCAAIAYRRRHPIAALLTVLVFDAAFLALTQRMPINATTAEQILIYTVAAWRPPRRSLPATLTVVIVSVLQLQGMSELFTRLGDAPTGQPDQPLLLQQAATAGMCLAAWVVGLGVRAARRRAARLRAERTEGAVASERVRIARELNDLTAHHVSGLVVQAGAAKAALRVQPDLAREALSEVDASARRTLAAMRAMLGLLRAPEPPARPAQPATAATPPTPAPAGEQGRGRPRGGVRASGHALAASVGQAVAATRGALPDTLRAVLAAGRAARERGLRLPRPARRDLAVAATLGVATVTVRVVSAPRDDGPLALDLPLLVIQCLPLLYARRHPLPMLALGAAAAFGYQLSNHERVPDSPLPVFAFGGDDLVRGVAMFLLCYQVARRRPPRQAAGALVLYAQVSWVVWLTVADDPFTAIPEPWRGLWPTMAAVALSLALQFPWVSFSLGALQRARRAAEAGARDRAVRAERVRIARELHDVVAHHISGLIVQTAAARMVLHTQPDVAAQVLDTIERDARETLSAMRKLVGVMADTDAAAPLTPQPSIAQVGELVAWARQAGLTVRQHTLGQAAPLAEETDLFAYRIVQEALTNAVKHTDRAHVTVTLTFTPDTLEIEVGDDGGRGTPPRRPTPGGQGLIGMRERVALLGGSLHAGPRAGGGWLVQATLPANPPSAARPAGQPSGKTSEHLDAAPDGLAAPSVPT